MRPVPNRRVQAQRKFAQGAYVPPNAATSVATGVVADTRRDVAPDTRRDVAPVARNVTINRMPAAGLLDVVSLQSTATVPERSGLNPQPVVLLERLRGRQAVRVLPPPQPASQAQQSKSGINKAPKEQKRVHGMSLRSKKLSKAVVKSITSRPAKKKTPLKRRQHSSDEDEPLIYQTRKKSTTAAPVNLEAPGDEHKQNGDPVVPVPSLDVPVVQRDNKNPPKDSTEAILDKVIPLSRRVEQDPEFSDSSDLPPLRYDESSDDEPLQSVVREWGKKTVITNRRIDSPEPGPSGMQQRKTKEMEVANIDHTDSTRKSMAPQTCKGLRLSFAGYGSHARGRSTKGKMSYQRHVALKQRALTTEASAALDRIRKDREEDIRRLEDEKQLAIARIVSENKDHSQAEVIREEQRVAMSLQERDKYYDRLEKCVKDKMRAQNVADRRMIEEVDTLAEALSNEEDAKRMHPTLTGPGEEEPGTSEATAVGGSLMEAPVFFPKEEDFKDPITFFEKIYDDITKYGVCKVVPPFGWKPPSEVHGDIRYDVVNQYVSRLFSRWGPAARELSAIKLCLQQQNISLSRPPQFDGVEINLSKLYHLVQKFGGLETVINKKRWGRVADEMKLRGGNYDKRLEHTYMKCLLPYDTLSHEERQDIMRRVEIAWNKKNQKLMDRAMNPLYRQKRMLGLMDSSDDETEEAETKAALKQAEDCIVKGALMQHSRFKKVATIAYENTFGQGSEAAGPPPLKHIEEQYWKLVTSGTEHACVHTASIDTGPEGHGFTTKEEPYASHPWNPKQVINNPRNVLKYLGPLVGVTVPTLLLGMLFSTSCWHKDPHAVAWYEYQSVGPTRMWYGIPENQADNFRKAVETLSPSSCQNKSLWLSSDITMIPPNVLLDHNVSLSWVHQNENEFVLAFPNAYSCCISTGYTESESVYFAPPSWLDCLWRVFKEARESCEPTMFSMEHLLYNIGRDNEPELDILKRALPLYDKMLRAEVTNRQMLQERGLNLVQKLRSAGKREKEKNQAQTSTYSTRHQEECDYCRASLFLSKVKGLPSKQSVLCLEHTLMLLDSDRYKDTDVRQLQVLVYVSVTELHNVHADMKRRLRMKD